MRVLVEGATTTITVDPETIDRLMAQGLTSEQIEKAAISHFRRRQCDKTYRLRHHQEVLERTRQWCQAHPQAKKALEDKWHREYPEKSKALNAVAVRRWRQTHPEAHKAYLHNRRDAEGSWTGEEWESMLVAYANCCAYCGTSAENTSEGKLTPDHIVPISRGGRNDISNIVPACRRCNNVKGTKTADEFLDSMNARSEEVISR